MAKRLFITGLMAFCIFVLAAAIWDHIHGQVPCNHGESSVSGHFSKNSQGKTIFITDQPVTRTGC